MITSSSEPPIAAVLRYRYPVRALTLELHDILTTTNLIATRLWNSHPSILKPGTPELVMFRSIGRSLPDLSADLRDRQDWEVGTLRTLDHVLNATTFAFDPVSSILAIGEWPS